MEVLMAHRSHSHAPRLSETLLLHWHPNGCYGRCTSALDGPEHRANAGHFLERLALCLAPPSCPLPLNFVHVDPPVWFTDIRSRVSLDVRFLLIVKPADHSSAEHRFGARTGWVRPPRSHDERPATPMEVLLLRRSHSHAPRLCNSHAPLASDWVSQ
jgi:hypothetical protein